MAVELRCPECKHPNRLKREPDEDQEITCTECDHVFTASDVEAADDEAPKKKKKPVAQEEKPKVEKKEPEKKPEQLKKRKKKKSKKRKTNPIILVGIVIGAVMLIGTVGGVLFWYFTKKSASQEMMSYLPDDCDEVVGVNLGHLQKYPEFYKACEGSFANTGFRKAGQLFATAKGAEFNDTFDFMIYGNGKAGGKQTGQPVEATVLRTKVDVDSAILAKIPGAKEGTANGVKYYAIPEIPELGYPSPRVFIPTPRLVVFCRGDIPDAKFKAMLGGNKENPEATPYSRGGALAKYAVRGTAWQMNLYDRSLQKPQAPVQEKKANPNGGPPTVSEFSNEDAIKNEIATLAGPAKGAAFKASVGSREIRGEWTLWYKSSEDAADKRKKWKEKEWVKDDEKDPPRWWKTIAQKSGGGKTADNVLKDNLSFRTSGELFTIRTSMDTKMIQQGVGGLVTTFMPAPPQPAGGGTTPPQPAPEPKKDPMAQPK